MAKINVESVLKNITNNEIIEVKTCGIKQDNRILFKDNELLVTINIFNNKITVTRKNESYCLKLVFILNKQTKNEYDIKDIGTVYLNITTTELVISDNLLKINYLVDDSLEKYEYKIKWRI